MTVLILGVNGFLGSAIAKSAVAAEHRVVGLSRSANTRLDSAITYISGSRNNHEGVRDLVLKQKIDVVIDIIPMTLADTQPLIDCLDGQVRQYVMLSSSDVYRNYELLQRKHTGTPTIEAVGEESALRRTRFPYRGQSLRNHDSTDRYLDDYDKIPIESVVRALSTKWTILRLPMVYGMGDKQKRFRWAIKPMQDAEQTLVIPRSWASWCCTYGYIDNVAEAVVLTLGNANAEDRVFNIGEERCVSQLEWAKSIAGVMGWMGSIELTDDPADPFARRIAGLDLSVPFRVSSRRIRMELGYEEVVDRRRALEATIASEIADTIDG